jgi:hypothetical protein
VISRARRLEIESAGFYEGLGQYGGDEILWRGFAQENRRNIAQVERAYYSVISDAIEGGFAFDIEGGDFEPDVTAEPTAGYVAALQKAIHAEETIARFYTTAAAQSQSLLADLPRLFKTIAQKRNERVQLIEAAMKRRTTDS